VIHDIKCQRASTNSYDAFLSKIGNQKELDPRVYLTKNRVTTQNSKPYVFTK